MSGNSSINNLASEYLASKDGQSGSPVLSRSITVTSAQDLIVADLHEGTSKVLISVETATCYVTFDGSTPTGTHGHPIAAGKSTEWATDLAVDVKIFCATSARVHVSEFQTK